MLLLAACWLLLLLLNALQQQQQQQQQQPTTTTATRRHSPTPRRTSAWCRTSSAWWRSSSRSRARSWWLESERGRSTSTIYANGSAWCGVAVHDHHARMHASTSGGDALGTGAWPCLLCPCVPAMNDRRSAVRKARCYRYESGGGWVFGPSSFPKMWRCVFVRE